MRQIVASGTRSGSMVLPDIIERHAQQAASLWHLRTSATRSPAYDLEALERLDNRLEAHIDGLRIAEDVGWEISRAALAVPGGGEVFVATVLAIERSDARALAEILARAGGLPELAKGIVSALGWVPLARSKRVLHEMSAGDAPAALHYFAVAGSAVHRHDLGEPLAASMNAGDLRLRARAMRAVGELGRADLLPALRRAFDADEDACRFWAAWSAARLGDPAASEILWTMARGESRFARAAADMTVRCAHRDVAHKQVSELAGTTGKVRIALSAAAALGDPATISWVIDCMGAVDHARFAGWTFSMITGADLAAHRLSTARPPGFRSGPTDDPGDSDVAPDPDASLPWPNIDAVRAWWSRHCTSFPPGRRTFLGRPLSEDWLWQVVRAGAQPARAAATLEIARMRQRRPLFEVRAPARRQQQMLSELQMNV